MSYACKGCKPTSKIKTFVPNKKQKILNDEKQQKSQRMVLVYATFLCSIMMLNVLYHFLTYQRTESFRVHAIPLMLARVRQAPRTIILVNHLKTTTMDRVTTYNLS